MKRAVFSPPERLIFEVQGVIIELKKEFFRDKLPLNDDETRVHKLCVRLENVLHYGAREKYTFMGTRKDYWNYISDCIPKDETVKFVQSISDIKTFQGKGRAFLRQALMEKSLADTLQRCAISDRMTKEYYMTDSIFRNEQLLQTLIHSLYDLNAVDFQLPYKGYDLDRSFPSFTRKTFGEKDRRASSSSSMSDQVLLPADPVRILNKNVDEVVNTVNAWLGKDNTAVSENNLNVSLQRVIDKIILLGEDVIKVKSRNQNEIDNLNYAITKLKDEKVKSDAENDLRMKQLNERFSNLQRIDTSATSDKFKELYDKVVATELELTETKAKCSILAQDASSSKKQLESSVEECEQLKSENKDVTYLSEELKTELAQRKHHEHSSECTNKIIENKLVELQKINDSLKTQEKETNEKLLEKESILKIKESELLSLQDAFQKSTGLVVGSFKELKQELNNQLKEKVDVLQNVTSANESLSNESKSLSKEKSALETQKTDLEQKNISETKKREEAEHIVAELKLKLTEEKNLQVNFQQFVRDIYTAVEHSDDENFDSEDGLLKKKKKKKKVGECEDLAKKSPNDEREAVLRRVMEMQQELLDMKAEKKETEKEIIGLKYELTSITRNFEELQNTSQGNSKEKSSMEKKCEDLEKDVSKLNIEIDKYNGEIFTMSLEVSKLNEQFLKKEDEYKIAAEDLDVLQAKYDEINQQKSESEKFAEATAVDLATLKLSHADNLNKVEELTVEKHALTGQVESTDALHTKVNEEIAFVKKEMENAIAVKNEEIQSLKFQRSTEEMKRETVEKELADFKKLKEDLLQDLSERDEKIKNIESEQSEHKTTLEVENEELANENTKIHKQHNDAKDKHEVAQKEITFLKVEVAKLAKEKEEEKATRINGWNRLNNLIEEKKQMEEKYRDEMQQLKEDNNMLKSHLVNVTQDKHELWTKKDYLEFELKQKADERWVSDDEVKECTNCQETFTLTLRRHHCRLCGHIFCHNCSNRWLKTQHHKKKVRACNVCSDSYKDLHGGTDMIDGGDINEDDIVSSSDQMSITDESFDEYRKNFPNNSQNQNNDELSTDPFEILDPADVSSSGSFGPSEQIEILSTDIKHAPVVPAVDDDETEESSLVSKETVVIQVPAGLRCLVPVVVGSSKFELIWEFSSTPKDVGFGIAYKDHEEKSDDEIQTSIPLSRYISHKQTIHGRMKVAAPGVYYLIFNNAYSRLTTKHVNCSIGLVRCKQ